MKKYPNISRAEEILNFCKDITRMRREDVSEISNLSNIFIRGRKTDKIPTSSSDITGNRVGDFNYDTSYIYVCVDNSGTAAWRRVSIGSW